MKRIFINGASSSIGVALAQYYAEQGAVLRLVARWQLVLEQLLAGLPHPEQHRLYVPDVNDHEALTAAAGAFIGVGNGIDMVIGIAETSQGALTAHMEDQKVFEKMFVTNVLATVFTSTPFVATMKRQAQSSQRDLRLVDVGSVAGISVLSGDVAYNGSKAAVIGYCASLRGALRGRSYQVIPWKMGVVAKLLRLLPYRLYDLFFSNAPHKVRKSES